MKTAHVLAALLATTTISFPAYADHHDHAAHAKQGAALQAKPGGCMHGEGCQHAGMKGGMHGGMGQHDGMAMHGFAQMLVKQSETLKLTDEQVGKLHRIAAKQGRDSAGMAQMHTAMTNLHQAMSDPASDEAAIRKAAAAHTAAFQAMIDDSIAQRNEALAVLTADQKKALKTLKVGAEPAKKKD